MNLVVEVKNPNDEVVEFVIPYIHTPQESINLFEHYVGDKYSVIDWRLE